ncbi:MAG: hypothetical protein IOD11_20680 [Rhodocyclaceae bacterium]|nr:hypothetical protein [Rhodocyclaceae bacterium]MCA3097453.1 hypothetical protein [Rhodocyclaceae bacterium]MCA3120492.1 hypothetical protein [Rhodocyclaceae bacterium]
MTLHAWIIELRGRVRERLCPDLQVLRYENELLRRALSAQRRALSAQLDVARDARDVGVDAYRRGYDDALNDALRNGMQWAIRQFEEPTQEKEPPK